MKESSNRRGEGAEGGGLAFERPIRDLERKIAELEALAGSTRLELYGEIRLLKERLRKQLEETYARLTPWERVNVARHAERPVFSDYVAGLCEDFFELHGDGVFGEDRAIATGLARIGNEKVLLLGHRKGKTTKERLVTNFGCAHPEGYRKALRKMHLAVRLRLPIVSLINTPGAYPGIGAEERGQARAIAENIFGMFALRTPIVCVVIGEGGSGGALGIGVGDRVMMLQNSYYSVISPEGCAAILWKSGEKAPEAAKALRLTAEDLHEFGVVDEIIPEPLGGAHRDPAGTIRVVRDRILAALAELKSMPPAELQERRYQKFRRMGALAASGV